MPMSDDFEAIEEVRVAGGTIPKDLAGCIIHLLKEDKRVRLATIGHQAVGQAVKAIPLVNQYCITQGYLVTLLPSFTVKAVHIRGQDGEQVPAEAPPLMEDRTFTMLQLVRVSPQ